MTASQSGTRVVRRKIDSNDKPQISAYYSVMESITLNLSEADMVRVKALAEKLKVTPEEAVKMVLEQRLRYEETVDHVLEKNEELYRRLS